MVLVSVHDLEDDVYPGVQEYAKCQSKAFMKGFIGFISGAAAGLTGSLFARQKFPSRIAPTHTVSIIAGGGIIVGYLAASLASRECQRNWVRTAQAAGYNTDDDAPPPLQMHPPSPGAQSHRGSDSTTETTATPRSGGYDEPDGPTFKKTKYSDTMG